MNTFKFPIMGFALLLTGASTSYAADCSRADIDHYLDKGFTPTQIIELCGQPAKTPPAKPMEPQAAPEPKASRGSEEEIREEIYLQTALDVEQVKLTPEALILVHDRCLPYGDTDVMDMKAQACLTMETRIKWKDMEIAKVVEPRVLIRDGELLVKGDIQREITNPKKMRRTELGFFKEEYPPRIKQINLPVKKGFSYEKVASALTTVRRHQLQENP